MTERRYDHRDAFHFFKITNVFAVVSLGYKVVQQRDSPVPNRTLNDCEWDRLSTTGQRTRD
jgi:hypothetical protein